MVDSSAPQKLDPTGCRFVVVEDDVFVADLLKIALERHFKPKELHVFSRGQEALEFCRNEPADLVITDLGLPDLDGTQLIRQLRMHTPNTRIIVLTGSHATNSLPGLLFGLGVAGYLDKASAFANTAAAVERVLQGGLYFSATGHGALAATPSLQRRGASVGPEALTPRERDIARMVASGMISKEIASQLDLSPRTVEKSRSHILDKLHLTDVPGLVRWCVQHRLV